MHPNKFIEIDKNNYLNTKGQIDFIIIKSISNFI